MSRYKVELVPQGAIPQDLNIGIQLNPLVEPGVSECSNDCGEWAVTVNDTPATGFIYVLPNEDFEVVVTHLGGKLCGCIEWELRAIRVDGAFPDSFTSVSIPDGQTACDSVTFVGDVEEAGSFIGLIFALFASIAGEPFCEPLIFVLSDSCTPTLVLSEGWYSLLDSPDAPPPTAAIESTTVGAVLNETVFPNRAFTMDFSPSPLAEWPAASCSFLPTATLQFLGGDPDAYGDFSIITSGGASAVFRLVADGAHDYTSIQITLDTQLLDYPVPPAFVLPNIIMNSA